MIRTVLIVIAAGAYMFWIFTPLYLVAWITRKSDALYRAGARGCRWAVWLAGIKLEIRGREKIPAGRAVVFMPNHQSMCDPPALMGILPPVLVLLKRSLFRIPALGPAMRMRGFVPIEREHRERAMHAVEEAAARLRAGHSFLVYPEGTRSPDGHLLPFKRGAFLMAMRAQAPIVPISVSGAYKIMRKGEMSLHPGTMRITFHDPVTTEGDAADQRSIVMEKVRAAIASGLSADEQPLERSS